MNTNKCDTEQWLNSEHKNLKLMHTNSSEWNYEEDRYFIYVVFYP